MATTFADLEARVRGLESRTLRVEEDITAIITTVSETHGDVKWLRRVVLAMATHMGLSVEPPDDADDPDETISR